MKWSSDLRDPDFLAVALSPRKSPSEEKKARERRRRLLPANMFDSLSVSLPVTVVFDPVSLGDLLHIGVCFLRLMDLGSKERVNDRVKVTHPNQTSVLV